MNTVFEGFRYGLTRKFNPRLSTAKRTLSFTGSLCTNLVATCVRSFLTQIQLLFLKKFGTCGLSVTTFFHQVLNYYYLTVCIMFKRLG